MDKKYYPVFLTTENKFCLIVGGGDVATRKAASLSECGAVIRVVSPAFSAGLEALARNGRIELCPRLFAGEDVLGAFLVIAATNDREVNRSVAAACTPLKIPVNVVDDPEVSTFIVPAVVRRGPLTIAVSTAGSMPALTARIRRQLEEEYDESYGELLTVLGETRLQVLHSITDAAERRRIFTALAAEDLLTILREEGRQSLLRRIDQIIISRNERNR
jgi:precorrin-2 dehydrogenase / sirohydrochlorin ferrochelatase